MQSDHHALVNRVDHNGIITLELNRPQQFNALSKELLSALQQQLDDIATDQCIQALPTPVIARAHRITRGDDQFHWQQPFPPRSFINTVPSIWHATNYPKNTFLVN